MRRHFVFLFLSLVSCNFDMGECYLRSDGSDGTDSVIITPTGDGDYGDVPPDPQSVEGAPPPVCNIASQTPCEETCESNHEADAVQCGKVDNEAQRAACNDSAYARYKSCRENCERTSNRSCDEKYQDCMNHGPWSCARPGSGSEGTKCRSCFKRCKSGDPTSPECKECLF